MDHRDFHGSADVCRSRGFPRAPRQDMIHGDTKRYATYFPSKASFDTKWNFSDDESTWGYSAPVAPTSRSSSSNTCNTACSSPAQELVIRYRAGMPLDFSQTRSSTSSSNTDVSWTTAPTYDASISEYVPVAPDKDLKAAYRKSRFEALLDTHEEALAVMKKCGLKEDDPLVCFRPGCRDTVRDMKALMYHLHIHNIHDQFTPPQRDGNSGSARHLDIHHCQTRRQTRLRLPPANPIKGGFLRVLTKIVGHGQRPT